MIIKKLKNNLLVLFLLIVSSASAQQDLTLYNMEVVPQRMYANPGLFPEHSRGHLGLPLISSQYLNVGNTGFRYKDAVRHTEDDSLFIDLDNVLTKLKKNNYLTASYQTDILSFGFAVKDNYFSFNITEKANVRFRYPKDLFEFGINGNTPTMGEELVFKFGLEAIHYREYGLGYVRKVNEKLSIGGKLKYLYGMENVWTEEAEVGITTDPTDFSLSTRGNLKIHTSGLTEDATNEIGQGSYFFKRKNHGFGIDLGANYDLNEKWNFSASVIDLGFITWKDPSSQTLQSVDPDASFKYEGLDLVAFINDTTGDPIGGLLDTLVETYEVEEKNESYRTTLRSQIYLGSNYNITEKVKVGGLLYAQIFDKKMQPAFALSFNQRLGKWFNYSISYSLLNRSATNLGFGFGLNLGAVQWYIVSDNVLAIFPQATKTAHIHTGINLTFGRKKDTDKDGIKDEKDLCPEIPGLASLNGCPDRDGDGLTDNDDMCPDDSGVVDLKGCPDRDSDRIIDLSDSCPDVFGLLEFNGCPDTDGDSIMDYLDSCPDARGSLELCGCPDKDGDGVNDNDDQCPEEEGLEENYGCPGLTLYLVHKEGNKLLSSTPDTAGNFEYDFLPADEVALFKLENGKADSIDKVIVVVNEVEKEATRGDDGLFRLKIKKAKEVEVKLEAKEAEVLKKAFSNLEFNLGNAVIKTSSLASLDELAALMNKKLKWRLKIAGHTDSMGGLQTNLTLSKKRAMAVRDYINSRGVDASRFQVEWYGEAKPIADNTTAAGRQKNRRVEMVIVE